MLKENNRNEMDKIQNFLDHLTTMAEISYLNSHLQKRSGEIYIESIRNQLTFDKKVVLRVSTKDPETGRRFFQEKPFPVIAISNEDFFYIKKDGRNQKKKLKQIIRFE